MFRDKKHITFWLKIPVARMEMSQVIVKKPDFVTTNKAGCKTISAMWQRT